MEVTTKNVWKLGNDDCYHLYTETTATDTSSGYSFVNDVPIRQYQYSNSVVDCPPNSNPDYLV